MKSNRRICRRLLKAEQLEKRELLAADFCCSGAVRPPDTAEFSDAAIVQDQGQTETDNTPLQQRDRGSEDCDTGVGSQQRPRDRDSEDAFITPNATLAGSEVGTALEAAAVRGGGSQNSPTSSQLSLAEEEAILFIREEEKLARDVYITLGGTWDAPIFDNIADSEQRHMDAVGQLIDKYNLDDPIINDRVGEFSDPVLQQLYDDLVSESYDVNLGHLVPGLVIEGGGTSDLAAYKVGAFIEEFDILDIQHAMEDVTHSDVQNVYENLLRGSRNHLRSFVSQIEAIDGAYEPVLMTGVDPVTGEDLDALYLEIISGDKETGNGGGRGGRRVQTAIVDGQTASDAELLARNRLFGDYGRHQ